MSLRGLRIGTPVRVALGVALLAAVAGLTVVATRPGAAPPGGRLAPAAPAPGSTLFKDQVSGADDPAGRGAGILDLSDRRNPFHDWSVLYVPSCTGDVYAGDAKVTYRAAGGRAVTIQHRGHVNAEAALGWVFGQVPHPARVFVAGCSAGSIGSILHAQRVIE